MSFFASGHVLNEKAVRNREAFAKHQAGKVVGDHGARITIGKGHIVEAKTLETLQFFSTHHDYRRGKIREYYVPQFPEGDELFVNASLKPGPQFDEVMYNDLTIQCEDAQGNLLVPTQITTFEELPLSNQVRRNLGFMKVTRPLPIQCFLIPFLLSQQLDLVAAAPTGAGKTIGILLPIIQHIINFKKDEVYGQRPPNAPYAIVVGATRDLVHQLCLDGMRLANDTGVHIKCAYGEYNRLINGYHIKEGCDVLVTTVGRLVDLVDADDVLVNYARFLAVDEADKLVMDEIFQDLLIVLKDKVRDDIIRILFSATFNQDVLLHLPMLVRPDYIRMSIIAKGISPGVTQTFVEVNHYMRKEHMMHTLMQVAEEIPPHELTYDVSHFRCKKQFRVPRTIIYGECRRVLDYLAIYFSMNGIRSISMHGGRSQKQRMDAVAGFKSGEYQLLIASNVAARGLNLPEVKMIINYDPPSDMDTYVHRIGRTGRLGFQGKSITYLNSEDIQHMRLAAGILDELKHLNHPIPPLLQKMAQMLVFGGY